MFPMGNIYPCPSTADINKPTLQNNVKPFPIHSKYTRYNSSFQLATTLIITSITNNYSQLYCSSRISEAHLNRTTPDSLLLTFLYSSTVIVVHNISKMSAIDGVIPHVSAEIVPYNLSYAETNFQNTQPGSKRLILYNQQPTNDHM